jgi:hypothetical protein
MSTPISTKEKACGPCQVCCVALKIDTPQLRKKAQVPCPHLVQKGCGIYEARPPVCRSFLCGWRLLPELDASWRPDLNGVMLLELPQTQLPKAYRAAGPGWAFVVTDGEKAITPRLARYIAGLVARRVAVFLSAMTPRIQLNQQLEPLVAADNLDGVLGVLRQTHALLLPARTGRGLGRIWALYRAQVDRMRAIVEQRQR